MRERTSREENCKFLIEDVTDNWPKNLEIFTVNHMTAEMILVCWKHYLSWQNYRMLLYVQLHYQILWFPKVNSYVLFLKSSVLKSSHDVIIVIIVNVYQNCLDLNGRDELYKRHGSDLTR
jgi:hypothetical protein